MHMSKHYSVHTDCTCVWLADGPGSTQGDAGNAGLTVKTLDMELTQASVGVGTHREQSH